MAWSPTPEVAAARAFAERFDKGMVIILSLDHTTLRADSYGTNVALCKEAKGLADIVHDAVIKHYED